MKTTSSDGRMDGNGAETVTRGTSPSSFDLRISTRYRRPSHTSLRPGSFSNISDRTQARSTKAAMWFGSRSWPPAITCRSMESEYVEGYEITQVKGDRTVILFRSLPL